MALPRSHHGPLELRVQVLHKASSEGDLAWSWAEPQPRLRRLNATAYAPSTRDALKKFAKGVMDGKTNVVRRAARMRAPLADSVVTRSRPR